ncbi:Ribosomal RNA small subunit methyltransferase B [Pseudonocardia sp. Ae406_Ps2]|nr:Ribosomal RNA small subunit methyltransferase B [Pseudonocardia sp. Ae406_Ps2]OLM07547.1 Ribosomal RNA small subunit methyltransferase B [Pseudonocardia sp. Ae331_Ps2]OLM22234.1 Ribosomal RNA small subunit methyltransferase B [Pseudonocardia sp. Ae706_Ps2]
MSEQDPRPDRDRPDRPERRSGDDRHRGGDRTGGDRTGGDRSRGDRGPRAGSGWGGGPGSGSGSGDRRGGPGSGGSEERRGGRDSDRPDRSRSGRDAACPRDGGDRPRGDRQRDDRPRVDRPFRGRDDRPRDADRPRGDRSDRRDDRPRDDRPRDDRPRGGRPGVDRPRYDRDDRPRGDRPQGDRPRPDRHRGDDRRSPRDDRGAPRRDDRGGDRGGDRGPRRERTSGPRNSGPSRGRGGPTRPPAVDPARQAAYELLTAVRERDAYANLALPGILRRHRLRDRDAALATELGYGTLRAQGLLDAIIDTCTDRPLAKIEHALLDALRLGAYQLLRTRVPDHAAVTTCVELVRSDHGSQSAGFVNAVLRRIGEHTEAEWLDRLAPDPAEDPVGDAALRHAHPRWIAQAFADALGGTGEELTAALAADDTRPRVHLLARPGEITAEELALATGGEQAPYSPYGVHLEPGSGDVGELDAVAEGLAIVQDEGSQLVAAALARAELLGEDTGRWLDLCAGPGGKASLLGGLVAARGGTLDAVESSEHRADLVRRSVAELPVTVHVADGREAPLPDGGYDRVLVDAPCTGLGALRRRPEARWRRRPEDIATLTRLQRELLTAALRHVRPGGVVAYVTCSPHVSETLGVVGRIVGREGRPGPAGVVEQLDARACLPGGMPGLGDGPTVQLWPHVHGTDAMFLALLRRPLTD